MVSRRFVLAAALAGGMPSHGATRSPSAVFLDPGSPSPAPSGPMARAAS